MVSRTVSFLIFEQPDKKPMRGQTFERRSAFVSLLPTNHDAMAFLFPTAVCGSNFIIIVF